MTPVYFDPFSLACIALLFLGVAIVALLTPPQQPLP